MAANPELYREFIASRHPDGEQADEVEASERVDVDEEVERSSTVFPRDAAEARPFLWDYQIKGFFKDACGMLRRADGTESKKIKAYKKEIDGLIFVTPRQIPLELPDGSELSVCERPLRAQTAQGERVALSRSEAAPVGTVVRFSVSLMKAALADALLEWFDYGQLRGLGQWRNSGKGRFSFEVAE